MAERKPAATPPPLPISARRKSRPSAAEAGQEFEQHIARILQIFTEGTKLPETMVYREREELFLEDNLFAFLSEDTGAVWDTLMDQQQKYIDGLSELQTQSGAAVPMSPLGRAYRIAQASTASLAMPNFHSKWQHEQAKEIFLRWIQYAVTVPVEAARANRTTFGFLARPGFDVDEIIDILEKMATLISDHAAYGTTLLNDVPSTLEQVEMNDHFAVHPTTLAFYSTRVWKLIHQISKEYIPPKSGVFDCMVLHRKVVCNILRNAIYETAVSNTEADALRKRDGMEAVPEYPSHSHYKMSIIGTMDRVEEHLKSSEKAAAAVTQKPLIKINEVPCVDLFLRMFVGNSSVQAAEVLIREVLGDTTALRSGRQQRKDFCIRIGKIIEGISHLEYFYYDIMLDIFEVLAVHQGKHCLLIWLRRLSDILWPEDRLSVLDADSLNVQCVHWEGVNSLGGEPTRLATVDIVYRILDECFGTCSVLDVAEANQLVFSLYMRRSLKDMARFLIAVGAKVTTMTSVARPANLQRPITPFETFPFALLDTCSTFALLKGIDDDQSNEELTASLHL